MGTTSLLSELLACVYSKYWSDAVKAGVVISQLSGTHDFYASVCRYPNGVAEKQVVCKAKGHTLPAALRALAVEWLIHTRRFEMFRTALLCPKPFDARLARTLKRTR